MAALEEKKKATTRAIKKAEKQKIKENLSEQEDFYKSRRALLQTSLN